MDKWEGKVALVTGASSGIGAAIAKRLVQHGLKVVGCARNIQNIQELAVSLKDSKGSLTAIQCDVSKEDQILSMFEQIKKQYGGVDICVNNAGLIKNAPILTGSTEDWRLLFDVNVIGLMMCTREAVKSMEERAVDDGAVILIGSIAGHKVVNNGPVNTYTATKFAVRAITEGLRNELCAKGSHIRVTVSLVPDFKLNDYKATSFAVISPVLGLGRSLPAQLELPRFQSISPGLTETGIIQRMAPDTPELNKRVFERFTPMQPDDIADAVIYSISAPVRTQVHDILMMPTEEPF